MASLGYNELRERQKAMCHKNMLAWEVCLQVMIYEDMAYGTLHKNLHRVKLTGWAIHHL